MPLPWLLTFISQSVTGVGVKQSASFNNTILSAAKGGSTVTLYPNGIVDDSLPVLLVDSVKPLGRFGVSWCICGFHSGYSTPRGKKLHKARWEKHMESHRDT